MVSFKALPKLLQRCFTVYFDFAPHRKTFSLITRKLAREAIPADRQWREGETGSWTLVRRADSDTLTRRVRPPVHAHPLPYFLRDDAAERRRGEYPIMPRCSSPGMDGRKDGRCLQSGKLAGARALAVFKKRLRIRMKRTHSFRSILANKSNKTTSSPRPGLHHAYYNVKFSHCIKINASVVSSCIHAFMCDLSKYF